MKTFTTTLMISTLLMGLLALPSHADEPDGEMNDDANLHVMSFNIRFGTANDGKDSWPFRHQLVAETIKKFNPDLLGVQEALGFQIAYLQTNLEDYAFHGAGRDDGKKKGEFCGIYYREDRFEKLDAGHFWLSETPDEPGSVSWDSSLTRMASWVKLKDKRNDRVLVFINTHFDHRGAKARFESAKLIRAFANKQDKDTAIIITGDFNAGEGSKPYSAFIKRDADLEDGQRKLLDAYRLAHPDKQEKEGTFNGFRGNAGGSRIDWVLHDDQFKVISSDIDRHHDEDRYPSDHFPVNAVLQWKQ